MGGRGLILSQEAGRSSGGRVPAASDDALLRPHQPEAEVHSFTHSTNIFGGHTVGPYSQGWGDAE